ncbi:glycosyl transferase family 1 [Leptolyngbya sp. 'hensonii']|uniref:glycosyltransferase family 4 protein n=1 Tax=Leptolyngbya sp. 'hensonii' TaxID=1922337 RepID=UPI00094FABA6|nr:glycosyltransferase family 4 protein [Leptolyngbya sp. 'hensonii']OLP20473.1 glycosyl transferase family 1 [Leptolyngbya sp. 'hensonii']
MRILSVHNRYQIGGGEDVCREAEATLLREKGHQVETYDDHNDRITTLGQLDVALNTVWSKHSYQVLKQRLTEQTFDVVHVHNFFPLISPAVFYAAQAVGVPVVLTLHNYRLMCANAYFFRAGQVCEDCMGKWFPWPSLVHGCYRGRMASGVVATMLATHRALGTWTHQVDRYITLTEFTRRKFIQAGLPADKIVVKPNFVYPDPGLGQGGGHYALFVGRLSPEKGIGTLLTAWNQLGHHLPLKVVGEGPLAPQVMAAAAQNPAIEWLGPRSLAEVYTLLQGATCLVFPSEWYEGLPRIVIEAFAAGAPVVASNLGAMSTLIQPHQTGLHFQPRDATDLVTQIQFLLEHPALSQHIRQQARIAFEATYSAESNYQQLMDIYTHLS